MNSINHGGNSSRNIRSQMNELFSSQQQSKMYATTAQGLAEDTFTQFDASENEYSFEEDEKGRSSSKNNLASTKEDPKQLPQINYHYGIDDKLLDPYKVKIEENKSFPLKLLHSNLITQAIDYLKYEDEKIERIELISSTLLFKKMFVYMFWIYYCLKFQNDFISNFVVKSLREKLKKKYMKLFVLVKPPKDDIFEIMPFILGKALILGIEQYLKNGKLILKNKQEEDIDLEMELYQIVHYELNGFTMSHSYLTKNLKKYIQIFKQWTINSQPSLQRLTDSPRNKKDQQRNSTFKRMDTFSSSKLVAITQRENNLQQKQGGGNNLQIPVALPPSLQPRRQAIINQENSSSKELLQFKNQLKKILMQQPQQIEKKKQGNMEYKGERKKPQTSRNTKNQDDNSSNWQWFGNDTQSQMSTTQGGRFNKFETSKLSPMFTSFYSSNAFTNPLAKNNIVLKKHITQSEERPTSNFEVLLRIYQKEKLVEIENEKKNNKFQLKQSNIRTLGKILGQGNNKVQQKEPLIKREERKWVIGKQIAKDGNFKQSPGCAKLVEFFEMIDKCPLNFNQEKRFLRNMDPKRSLPELLSSTTTISSNNGGGGNTAMNILAQDLILKRYREEFLTEEEQQEEEKQHPQLTQEQLQRRKLKVKYEQKMKRILKRKNVRMQQRKEELDREQQVKERKFQQQQDIININQKKEEGKRGEQYQDIKNPYLKDEDVDYYFDTIFEEFEQEIKEKRLRGKRFSERNKNLSNSISRKKTIQMKKRITTNCSISQHKDSNIGEDSDWEQDLKQKRKSYKKLDSIAAHTIVRKELIFKGGETPTNLKKISLTYSQGEEVDIEEELKI